MKKDELLKKRADLMANAKNDIVNAKAEEAQKKMDEIKKIDEKIEKMNVAEANLKALDNKPAKVNNLSKENKELGDEIGLEKVDNVIKKANYVDAFAKTMLGQKLTPAENEVFVKENAAFSHSTENTGILIPDTVVDGIFKIAEEQYPLFADMKGYNVRGSLTINKHDGIVSGDAQWVDESTQADDEQNSFGQLVLKGFELNKVATVKWKMKSMSVESFIEFLTQELADRIGVALGVAAHQGTGVKSPKGVEVQLKAEAGTPQVVQYTGNIAYKDITGALAKIHSSYAAKSVIYVNNATLWNQLANITDTNGRPLFIADPTGQTVGQLFGHEVKVDAGTLDGEVLIGDTADTVVKNVNQAMSLAQEDHVKGRSTDYGAYTIVDFGMLTTKGFALLSPKTASAPTTPGK
ncbi:MAG: phage major capsid protein [Liquorilactobacillus ghanensis]|uniref:phage major capsid protein n=1 Tax=Liquorilactobacillus ghanensis TaxID=399370 RepID=UPI0039E75521